jgi:hypothetical protein
MLSLKLQKLLESCSPINKIFTNSQYGIIRENLCFAYKIISIENNIINASSLKLDTISEPQAKLITNLSQCGKKVLSENINNEYIMGECENFIIDTFGNKYCIRNDDKFLVEFDFKNDKIENDKIENDKIENDNVENDIIKPIWLTISINAFKND